MSQQQKFFPTMESINFSQSEGYNVMHSYPFISDGPKINHRHSYHPSTPYQQQQMEQQYLQQTKDQVLDTPLPSMTKPECTRKVPPGVIHIKPTWKPVKLDEKPPFSYATIIAHAILSSEHRKLTLSEIYQWISEQYPCYSMKDHRWQNSIRHNLSLQKAFVKLERDANTPSGKGCFWTILPGYEQQFIDNLVKRGMGGAATGSSGRKHSNSISSTSNHKQFRKFIDASVRKSNSPLFTIFRMNPTTTSPSPVKRKKSIREKKTPVDKKPEEQELQYDSDCDSGVDLDCEVFPKKDMQTQTPLCLNFPDTALQQQQQQTLPPPPPPPPHQNFDSLLMENSMFIPDNLFVTQQPNILMPNNPNNTSNMYFNTTPSSMMMDQPLFTGGSNGDSCSSDYWPSAQQTPLFDFQSQPSQMLSAQPTPQQTPSIYDPASTCYPSLNSTDNNGSDYLLQQPQSQPFQDYYLYNDFC